MTITTASRFARIITLFVLATFLLACDPGITIQPLAPSSQSLKSDSPLRIDVWPTNQLIGEEFYPPRCIVTNLSVLPVSITNVELVSKAGTYPNQPVRQKFPLSVAPGKSEQLETIFRLDRGVYKVFEEPAELRVRYTSDGKEDTAVVTIASKQWARN